MEQRPLAPLEIRSAEAPSRPDSSGQPRQPLRLGDLSLKALYADGDMTGADLERMFRDDDALMSILISDTAAPGRVGLITRLGFYESMTGRLGFGWLLNATRKVAALASWDPLTMPHDTPLDTVSTVVLERPKDARDHDLVISWPDGSFGTVSVSSVFERLAMEYGYEATHDRLTALPNRVLLLDRLSVLLKHAERVGSLVAVVFCDLDGFKRINDSLGHEVGDRLLAKVARRFASTVRSQDTLARIGGDEFVVVCEIGSPHAPVQVAERLIASLAAPIIVKGHQVRITTSVGITVTHGTATDPEELVREADLAMYRAKTDRRGGFEIFDAAMHARAVERLTVEQELGPAMGRDEFRLFYQPLVGAADRRLVAFEALVRWQLPTGRMRAPVEFIDIAEDCGFITTLGAWVLGEACRQLAEWRVRGAGDFRVGVNVSARQFSDPGLLAYVASMVEACNLGPGALVLEITESNLMQHVETSMATLTALRRLGVVISVDDFGTGYSSLAYLAKIPLDSVKIDKSFVTDLESNHTSRMLASTVISLAHNLGVRSVGEGVENENQLAILMEMGCDLVQGYLIGRPHPPEQVEQAWFPGTARPSPDDRTS
jgi:diguanylate cyclase (GGDEF)-like protein